jgi:hypothetical protein
MRTRSLVLLTALAFTQPARTGTPRAVTCDVNDLTLAIRQANAAGGGSLGLAAGCTYTINTACLPATAPGRCEWGDLGFLMGPSGLPAITSAIVIEGNGATIARDPAAPPFRLFTVAGPFTAAGKDASANDVPNTGALTLRDLTIKNGAAVGGSGGDGAAPGGGGAGLGGCLFVAGALTLDRATLEGCSATGGAPGNVLPYTGSYPPNGGGGGLGGQGGSNSGGGGGGGFVGAGGSGFSAGGGGAAGRGADNHSGGNAAGGGGTTQDASGTTGGGSDLAAPWSGGGNAGQPGATGGGGGGCTDQAAGGSAGGFGGGGGGCDLLSVTNAAGGAGGFGGGGGSGPVYRYSNRVSTGGGGGFGGGGGGGADTAGAGGFAGGSGGGGQGNVAPTRGLGLGGGIFLTGTISVTRSTLYRCAAQDAGGAIFAHGGDGAALGPAVVGTGSISNSTFAYGAAPLGSAVASINSVLTVTSSALGGSCARAVLGHFGTVISGGANAVTDGGDCALASAGDQAGTASAPLDLGLRPYDDYGGLTRTLLPLQAGPLPHAGLCADAADQRELPVPATGCDVGSTQLEGPLDLQVPCDVTALTAALRHAALAQKATLHLQAGCTYSITEPCTPKAAPSRCQWQDLGFFMGPNGLPLVQSDVTIEGNGATIARSSATSTAPFRLFTVAGPFTEIARQTANPAGVVAGYPGTGALTLRNVRLTNGFARGGPGSTFYGAYGGGGGAGLGGCLLVAGSAVLDRSTVDGCVAEGGGLLGLAGGDGRGGGGLGGAGNFGGGGFMGNAGFAGGGAAGDAAGPSAGGTTGDAATYTPGGSALGDPWGAGGAQGAPGGIGGGGGESFDQTHGMPGGFGAGGGAPNTLGSVGRTGANGGFGGGGGGGGDGGFGGGGGVCGAGGFGGGAGSRFGSCAGGGPTPGQGLGGAIFATGSVVVRRSTLSGNTARSPGNVGIGGALFAYAGTPLSGGPIPGATVTITSSTLDGNLADQAAALALWDGSAASVQSSVLGGAASCGLHGTGAAAGALTSGGANFVADGSASTGFTACAFGGTGDAAGTAATPLLPLLGALGDHGGQTPTEAPADESPLLGNGHCSDTADQRGVLLLSAPVCDQGSVERTRIGVTVTLAGAGAGTVTSDTGGVACPGACAAAPAARDAMTLTATATGGSTFAGFTGDCTGATCAFSAAGAFHVTATFTAPVVADAGTADAGTADAGTADAGNADAGNADAGNADAGIADAGSADAGIADAGIADAGIADAGIADAGIADAGGADAGIADAGNADAGAHGPPAANSGGCGSSGTSADWLALLPLLAGLRKRRSR